MLRGGARGQNLEHLRIFFFHYFSCMELFIFEQQVLYGVDSLSIMTSNLRLLCTGWGGGGQNLGHLRIYVYFFLYFYFSFMESFVFEQKALYMAGFLSVTSDYRVQCPRVGLGSKSRTS